MKVCPNLPDTIHFNHTAGNDRTEVMRITRDGVWVNPDMAIDETAKAVLDALSSQVKVLVQRAVEDEREACEEAVEEVARKYRRQHYADAENIADECVAAIRARGEKPPVKSYCGGNPNYCTPEVTPEVDAVNMSQDRVDEKAKDRLVRIMGTFDLATGHADTLDQALDALEEELRDVLGHLRARQQQEPFIYIREDTEMPFGGYEHCGQYDAGAFPVYLAPPKRDSSSWVGLTDADIAQTMHGSVEGSNMLPYQFARAIEAKLKEKNGG